MKMLEERLGDLWLELPTPSPSIGTYVGYIRTGTLIFTAGQGGDGYTVNLEKG